MKTCVLFVALLVASTYAVQMEKPANFLALGQDTFIDDVLEQIKGTPLGRSVSALIRIKMKAGEADYTRLFAAFDQLRQFLKDQTEENRVRSGERQRQNTLMLQNQQAIIDEQAAIMTAGNTKIRQWSNTRHSKQNIFNSNTGTIEQTTEALGLVVSTREANMAAYNADRARIVQAIEGCRAAVECLNQLKQEQNAPAPAVEVAGETAPALIQMTSRETLMGHMIDASNQLAQVKSMKKQTRILKSLIRMTQEYTDQSNLDKVIDLINQLKSDLWDKLAALDEAEEAAVTNYEQTVTELQSLIDVTVEENTTLGGKIENLTTKIDTTQGRVDTASEVHETATGRHGMEVQRYAAFVEEVQADNERIEFELSVLDRAESILAMEGISRSEF